MIKLNDLCGDVGLFLEFQLRSSLPVQEEARAYRCSPDAASMAIEKAFEPLHTLESSRIFFSGYYKFF
jgi:hypothetical protein